MRTYGRRLLVVSNRLPITIEREGDQWQIRPGHGGLVTALKPVLDRNAGLWIGWAGNEEAMDVSGKLDDFSRSQSFQLKPVSLTPEEVTKYYRGFSNETLWPLFHDLLGHSKFDQENWVTYDRVNRRFAEVVAQSIQPDDFVWIHDYQLVMVGCHLREMGVSHPLAYFLHIPFPALDLYRRLPWKYEIVHALMDYDLLGFQTLRDRRNFVQCVRGLMPEVEVEVKRRYTLIRYGPRTVKAGNYPIGIDFREFDEGARSQEVAEAAWYMHENIPGRQLILGVDRLDYTKGIPDRFLAFERALEKYPELQKKVSLVQVVVPSRTHVPDYQNLRELLDGLVGRINGRFAQHGWIPVHYMYRSLDRQQLLGHYKACEIALITPLRDGMNLIAKEFCASSIDLNGVLILSEFAGAADQLARGAILVNPYDLEGTADAIYQAFHMNPEERKRRMQVMRSVVRRNNVHRWVKWFMDSLVGRDSGWRNGKTEGKDAEKEIMDMWSTQTDVRKDGEDT
jgi:trehalose 6-phosphate synthase/phosphatase